MTLVLLNYNKYKNRQFKKEDTIADYFEKASSYEVIDDYDFNPADGVSTSLILGGEYYDYEDKYDYLIVCDGNEIVSRWFILDANRTRIGQYQVTLHRDCVVDHYDEIINAPAFIEKATLADDDPLILTKEPVSVNEIKTSETILTDETECAWLIGYVARNYAGGNISIPCEITPDVKTNTSYSAFAAKDGTKFALLDDLSFSVTDASVADTLGLHTKMRKFTAHVGGAYSPVMTVTSGPVHYYKESAYPAAELLAGLTDAIPTDMTQAATLAPKLDGLDYTTQEMIDILLAYDGKILSFTGGELYKCEVSSERKTASGSLSGAGYYQNQISTNWVRQGYTKQTATAAEMVAAGRVYSVKMTRLYSDNYTIAMPAATGRFTLKDAPYDMFCVPYPLKNRTVTIKNTAASGFTQIAMDCTLSMAIAQGIASSLGSNMYDLQLLPFCPFGVTMDQKTININESKTGRWTAVKKETTVMGYIFWSLASQGEKRLTFDPVILDNIKMGNQCDKYRILSGSYGSAFEISPAKNGGRLREITADYTYIPYSPYIHVNPEFDGLYGKDFDDVRGMVDQSNRSISYISDAWQQYQINNASYADQFTREMQNMEVHHKYDMLESGISALTGAGVSGIGIGAMLNPVAGIAAGAASLGAGVADQFIKQGAYNEDKQLKEDMHNYSLKNIQALPYTLAKVTAFCKNNKVFPIVERYTCTDREKEAFANYIRYNGMTCGVVGKISDYLGNSWSYGNVEDKGFVQATIIQAEDMPGDNHMLEAINYELERGVYFK